MPLNYICLTAGLAANFGEMRRNGAVAYGQMFPISGKTVRDVYARRVEMIRDAGVKLD